jgi:outer membrane receptor for Fe3+-dicitrate
MSLLTPLLPQVLPRLWSGQLLWNYTVQSTKNASDIMHYQGNKLPSEPSHELSQSVSYDWNDVFTMEYELQYHTTLYQDLANTIAIPSQIYTMPWLAMQ